MDQFSPHKTDQVFNNAAELRIDIIWIWEGATGIYQSIDRRVLAALKSKGRAKWRCFYAENYGDRCNRETAAWLLFELRDELSDSAVTAAWDFKEQEPDSDSDDSDDGFELRVDTDGEDLNDEVDPD
jgi:hypothetical protein